MKQLIKEVEILKTGNSAFADCKLAGIKQTVESDEVISKAFEDYLNDKISLYDLKAIMVDWEINRQKLKELLEIK